MPLAPHLGCCRGRSILARISVAPLFGGTTPLSDTTTVLPYADDVVAVLDLLASGAAVLPVEAIDAVVDPDRTTDEVEDPVILEPDRTPVVGLGSPVVVLPASDATDEAGILAPVVNGNLVVGCDDNLERLPLLAEERGGIPDDLAVAVDVMLLMLPERDAGASATDDCDRLGMPICCLPVNLSGT